MLRDIEELLVLLGPDFDVVPKHPHLRPPVPAFGVKRTGVREPATPVRLEFLASRTPCSAAIGGAQIAGGARGSGRGRGAGSGRIAGEESSPSAALNSRFVSNRFARETAVSNATTACVGPLIFGPAVVAGATARM